MDIEGLQDALRQFAAQRSWQSFHTPKYLAMALMVRAAELAEIFQWMTPEESREASNDPATKQHIGEVLADITLYLLQLADHTGTDLRLAVRERLAQNAQRDPPAWKVDLDRRDGASDSATHVLLDYENVQPTEEELRALVPEATNLWVFHGPHQKEIAQRFGSYGAGMTAVPISRTGKNSLDFHLSFYMGYIASRNQEARIIVVANDTGYQPVLEHAKALGFAVRQHGHSRPSGVPSKKSAAGHATPAASPKAATGRAPVKKAVAAKTPGEAASRKKATANKTPAKKARVKKAQAPAPTKIAKAPASADALLSNIANEIMLSDLLARNFETMDVRPLFEDLDRRLTELTEHGGEQFLGAQAAAFREREELRRVAYGATTRQIEMLQANHSNVWRVMVTQSRMALPRRRCSLPMSCRNFRGMQGE